MKKKVKSILAVLCAVALVLPIFNVPKAVEAATAAETDSYKFVSADYMAGNVNGVVSTAGTHRLDGTSGSKGKITNADGLILDCIYNFPAGAMFVYGGTGSSNQRLQINTVSKSGVPHLRMQMVGRNDATDTGIVDVPIADLGLSKGFDGQDVRMVIGVNYTVVDETNAKVDAVISIKIGSTYQTELKLYSFPQTPFNDAKGIITWTSTADLTIKTVKPDTDYKVVGVEDFTGVKDYMATTGEAKYADGVTTFDGVMLDGIYRFHGLQSTVNIGSMYGGLQINPVGTGNLLRYQVLDFSKTGAVSRYGKDVTADILGEAFFNDDIRIRVGFTYYNVVESIVQETVGEETVDKTIVTADVTIHLQIGESYEDIFTIQEMQVTDHLTTGSENICMFLHGNTNPISVKAGAYSDFVEITPADYGISDINGNTDYNATKKMLLDTLTGNTRLSLNGKVLSADVQFVGDASTNTYIGFGGANWLGVRFGKLDDNTFFFNQTIAPGFVNGNIKIDAKKAGLTSANDAFNVKIGVEFVDVDFDNEEDADDVKYSLWIDDKLCAVRYTLGIVTSIYADMFVDCRKTDASANTIIISTPKQELPDDTTPYILEDFGARENKYYNESTEVDEYYYNAFGGETVGGSSISGKVALSEDAKLSVYGKTGNEGYKVIGSEYIAGVGADGVFTHSGSEFTRNLSNISNDKITSMDGIMFDGMVTFPDQSYIVVGGGTSTQQRFQMQMNSRKPGLVCQFVTPANSNPNNIVPLSTIGVGVETRVRIGFSYSDVNMTNRTATITVRLLIGDSYEATIVSPNQSINPYENATDGVLFGFGGGVTIKPAPAASSYTDKGLTFSMTDAGLALNSTFSGLTLNVPFADVTAGETFDFTVAKEVYDLDNDGAEDDVRFSIFVNGNMYLNKKYYVLNFASKTWESVYLSSGCTVEPTVNIDVQDLSNSANGYVLSGKGVITVNDEDKALGTVLDRMGDYTIRCSENGAYVKLLVLSRSGNVHLDEDADVVDARDLVALKKAVENGATFTTRAAEESADVDGNDTMNDNDLGALRLLLVESDEVLPRRVSALTHEDGVMPIVGFYGPYRATDTTRNVSYDFLTDEIYQMIKDVGINQISYTSAADYKFQPQTALDALALADKYDIGMYLTDSRVAGEMDATRLAKYMREYAQYESFKGYFIVDEPSTSACLPDYQIGRDMSRYTDTFNTVNGYTNLMGYMNMYPKKVVGTADADNKYDTYIEKCLAPGMKMVSWDYYPFDASATISEYFEHLSLMREKSLEKGLPFWSFAQAGTRWNDGALELDWRDTKTPTKDQLLWNVNTSLAYGAKGIQYFTLIQPYTFAYEEILQEGDEGYDASHEYDGYDYDRNSLIGANGEPTKWYEYAQTANKQVAAVDEYLLRATTLDVLADGTKARTQTSINKETYKDILTSIDSTNGAVVGVFDYQGKTAFYVVNYDTTVSGADNITLNFGSNQNYSVVSTQLETAVSTTSGTSCTLSLRNGGAALVILK